MVIDDLRALRAASELIRAAREGYLTDLRCAMPICHCPDGRSYFEPCGGSPRKRWIPSADRFPVLGRDGGTYEPDNVRLSHWFCNLSESGRLTSRLRKESGQYQSPAHRELGRQLSRRGLPAIRRWERSPECHAIRAETCRRVGKLPTTDAERAINSASMRVKNCVRWNLNRGKPCVCGHHGATAANA